MKRTLTGANWLLFNDFFRRFLSFLHLLYLGVSVKVNFTWNLQNHFSPVLLKTVLNSRIQMISFTLLYKVKSDFGNLLIKHAKDYANHNSVENTIEPHHIKENRVEGNMNEMTWKGILCLNLCQDYSRSRICQPLRSRPSQNMCHHSSSPKGYERLWLKIQHKCQTSKDNQMASISRKY